MDFIPVSVQLDRSGLLWEPEIGDEVTERGSFERVAILVDPQGLSPSELRDSFVWLPTVEQLVDQIESRQGLIYHLGISESAGYEAVVKSPAAIVEVCCPNLRIALGQALYHLLQCQQKELIH